MHPPDLSAISSIPPPLKMNKKLGHGRNETRNGKTRWDRERILTLILTLGAPIGATGCVTVDHPPSSQTQKVLVRDFEDIEFVHAGKNYLFQLQEQRFANMKQGFVFWIPEAEALIPEGELGGAMYREREPIVVASHSFRVTGRYDGVYDDQDTSINSGDAWSWIESEYPGAQRRPTNTFGQGQESVRHTASRHP